MSPPRPRRMLALGALFTALGLATTGTSPVAASPGAQQLVGGFCVVIGWALLILGIHRFGRESP